MRKREEQYLALVAPQVHKLSSVNINITRDNARLEPTSQLTHSDSPEFIVTAMALAKKSYPKGTIKKIIKAHSNRALKKNVDVTVSHNAVVPPWVEPSLTCQQIFLNYVLFMEKSVQPC